MAKFDNAKVGDKIFLIGEGWCKVRLRHRSCFYLENEKGLPLQPAFYLDGRISGERTVVCYWKEVILPTNDEDKKPFDLIKFLRENLKPKEFEQDKSNRYISYEYDLKKFEYYADYHSEDIGTVYIEELDDYPKIISELTINKVTPKQLKQAYKTLGWL